MGSSRVPVPGVVGATRARWLERLDEMHLLTPARIVGIVIVAWLLALVVTRLVSRLVERALGVAGRRSDERTSPRSMSLTSALRGAALAVIWVVAVIAVIGEVGIDVSGVIVTATVVGGAIAFGAQALVRDVIAGVFVLSEDQYAVGDVIDVGPIGGGTEPIVGAVERMTLRTTRLRDADGRVWHVPNGNVLRVANLSKESTAVLTVDADRNVDLAAVRGEVQRLGIQLVRHDAVGAWCVGELGEVTLDALRDDRIVVRSHISTVPGRQGDVEAVWRELVLAAYRTGRIDQPG